MKGSGHPLYLPIQIKLISSKKIRREFQFHWEDAATVTCANEIFIYRPEAYWYAHSRDASEGR
jgi:hypothetical protein